MFEEYSATQPIAIKTLENALKNNKLSHAYIFETNGYNDSYDFILKFIKYIVCPKIQDKSHNEMDCGICSSINNNNYVELKVINPTTLQIKKEEMLLLQQEFKNKAIAGKKKIYLIKNADKLNTSSANTILKFLEEPEENIIAILVTPSRYMLLDTIISRCQVISLRNANNSDNDLINCLYKEFYYKEEYNDSLIEKIKNKVLNAIKFIDYLESNKKETLLFTSEYIFKNFENKEELSLLFYIIKNIYYDSLKYNINNQKSYFEEYNMLIAKILRLNTTDRLSRKLGIIIKSIDKLKYNVNTSLLIDKFVMEMGAD